MKTSDRPCKRELKFVNQKESDNMIVVEKANVVTDNSDGEM